MDARIKTTVVDIDSEKTQQFWENRAENFKEEDPYSSVKLGVSPAEVNHWNDFEKKILLEKLHIDETSHVIDLGCGVGRICELIHSHCHSYLGLDYAEKMIALAKDRNKDVSNASFCVSNAATSLLETLQANQQAEQYNKILFIGVCLYLNDDEVKAFTKHCLEISSPECDIYITLSEGKEERLTLNNFQSETLNAEYSAIYRTYEEYLTLFQPLFQEGFEIQEHDFLEITRSYSETQHTYLILSRKA